MHDKIFEVDWKRPHTLDFRWLPNSTLTRTRSAIVKKGCKLNDRYAKKRRQTFFSENLFGGKLPENSTVNQRNFATTSPQTKHVDPHTLPRPANSTITPG